VENTSWSCVHGVERWRSNCGCNGGKADWNQAWRAPLRKALDELRDALVPLTEQEGGKLFKDVWAARDGYIEAMLDRSPQSVEQFFRKHQSHAFGAGTRARAGIDGDAAPHATDVHQLRMVLRRHFGH
jgi:alpha-amylase/alpha-mannosidase (GH57 family)